MDDDTGREAGSANSQACVAPGDDEHLRAIGLVTTTFGALELIMMTVIGSLLEVEQEKAEAIVGDMSFSAKLRRIRALIPLFVDDDELQGRWASWAADAEKANRHRNDVTHSAWAVGAPGQLHQWRLGAKQRTTFPQPIRDSQPFDDVADEVNRVLADLMRLIVDTPGILA